MQKSESIKELALALSKFQKAVGAVTKDSINPHFKSKYASLDSIWESIRPKLEFYGLSVSQFPSGDNELTTIVMHSSGEWIADTARMNVDKPTPQGQGSAITYMRRYALSGALGLSTEEDDDGNAAETKTEKMTTSVYRAPQNSQGGVCPEHGQPWREIPAGVSTKTGEPYEAFTACPVRGCRQKPPKKEEAIDTSDIPF